MFYFWYGECPNNRLSPRGAFLLCLVELELVFCEDWMPVGLVLNLHEINRTALLLLHEPLFCTSIVEDVFTLRLEQLLLVVDYTIADLTSWLLFVAQFRAALRLHLNQYLWLWRLRFNKRRFLNAIFSVRIKFDWFQLTAKPSCHFDSDRILVHGRLICVSWKTSALEVILTFDAFQLVMCFFLKGLNSESYFFFRLCGHNLVERIHFITTQPYD